MKRTLSITIVSALLCLSFNSCRKFEIKEVETTLSSQALVGDPFSWPVYSPGISYDFSSEYPALNPPTQVLNDCANVAGTLKGDWWCFRWGPNANSLVTPAAIQPMLDYFDAEFSYFRDTMGWPMDKRARNGYYSSIYLYGSGLCTDNAPNTALGGWQSAVNYNGQNWPIVLASYYPVYSFDPSCPYPDAANQRSAMIHEGIHALLADYEGLKNAAWFHEGGNVWFQQTADAARNGNYSTLGWLGAGDAIAPFMPIECYSGWLLDGSFGGPSAEGVNLFNGNQQVCTWRRLLGGKQYSSVFPTFLGLRLGNKAVPWLWRYSQKRVLEGLSEGIGAAQTRRLITEYRAKQATVDMGEWSAAYTALIDNNFGSSIAEEWQPALQQVTPWIVTPYAKTTNTNNVLKPDTVTLPGWSGANQIPLTVQNGATQVKVNFQPIGQHMTCQLVYRSTTGNAVYSAYVSQGECVLNLTAPPANGVVVAVITNNDFLYNGEATRKAKFSYRLRLVNGVSGTASVNTKWYKWNSINTSANMIGTMAAQKTGIDWSEYCRRPIPKT